MTDDISKPGSAQKPGWPVRWIPGDDPNTPLQDGVALCLSGGGYRAMLFHVGAIWRLNELGYLDRGKLKRVSSVSGGSLTAPPVGTGA
jgi:NTE family protein